MHVRINWPANPILHNETGVVADRPESDEAVIRFDVYKSKFDAYDDTRRGSVTVNPEQLDLLDE